jgi:hypothetical protein
MRTLQKHLLHMAAGAAIAIPAVTHAAPVPALGAWDDCNFGPALCFPGPNTVATIGITGNFDGSLDGKYEGSERDVVTADGSATFHGSGIFTGTVSASRGRG